MQHATKPKWWFAANTRKTSKPIFPDALIEIDTGIDYKFRTSLPKAEVAVRLQRYVMSELNVREAMKRARKKKIS